MTRRKRDFPRLTSTHILDALEARHRACSNGSMEWAFAREIPVATGGFERRIDALAMNCWRSKRYLVVAYEVKVSRADFLQELRKPEKSETARRLTHEFVFATPKGMVDVDELPEWAGLIEVDVRGRCVTRKRAPRTERDEWSATFLASVIRSAQRTAIVDKSRIHATERARVYAEVLAHHAARGDEDVPSPDAVWYDWIRWARRVLGDDAIEVNAAVALLGFGYGGVDRTRQEQRALW